MTETVERVLGGYHPYAAYKPSGIDWLGEVPEHWEVRRLKTTVRACINGTWGSEATGDEDDIICIRVADFDRTRDRVRDARLTVRAVPSGDRRGRLLEQGDLLLEKSGCGELQPVGKVVLYDLTIPAVSSNFIARMPVAQDCDSNFLCYLHDALYSGRVNTRSIKQTTGIQNLDSDAYLNERVGIPPLSEQQHIANLLDQETAKIDITIAKYERLKALLQEKRQALISHAVTKGLDPDAPMKDSGVEWLGEIPVHWEVSRLKFVAQLESGHTPSRTVAEYWENCSVPWVSLKDLGYLRANDYVLDTTDYINELGLANSSARILPAGTVVLSRDATVGRCGILGREMATSQHFVNWICGARLIPEYLLLIFRGPMQREFERLTMGATLRTIGMPEVNGFVVPVPPISEQRRLVAYVRDEAMRINEGVERIERAIDLLREHRTSLISAAVTGKIDVREDARIEVAV